jgi:transcription factor IIIB subunit 2
MWSKYPLQFFSHPFSGLLIAARLHGFKRSHKDIIQVVRVCEMTLRKRLVEFEKTPSGQLTAEDFETVDLDDECDPPAFTQAREKESPKKKIIKKEEEEEDDEEGEPFEVLSEGEEQGEEDEILEEEQGESQVLPQAPINEEDVNDAETTVSVIEKGCLEVPIGTIIGTPSQSQLEPLSTQTQATPVPSTPISTVTETKEVITTIPAVNPSLIDLTPLEDDEVLGCLHSAEEVKSKTELWDQLNRDFEEKQQERKRLEAEGVIQPKVSFYKWKIHGNFFRKNENLPLKKKLKLMIVLLRLLWKC